jgi:hypothetical protein
VTSPLLSGAVRETWEVTDRCPGGITVTVPSLPTSATSFQYSTVHRPQWHDGLAFAPQISPDSPRESAAVPAEAIARSTGGAANLTGIWTGDVLVGQMLCNVAMELDALVRIPL